MNDANRSKSPSLVTRVTSRAAARLEHVVDATGASHGREPLGDSRRNATKSSARSIMHLYRDGFDRPVETPTVTESFSHGGFESRLSFLGRGLRIHSNLIDRS